MKPAIERAVARLGSTEFLQALTQRNAGAPHPSTVMFIRPIRQSKHIRSDYEAYIPTRYIAIQVTEFLSSQDQAIRLEHLKKVKGIGGGPSRAFAGYLFEAEIHLYFSGGGDFSVTWDYTPPGGTPPNEILQSQPPKRFRDLSDLEEHCAKSSIEEVKPFYWQPIEPNFPAIDSILYPGGNTIFAIQATIAWEHTPITHIARKKLTFIRSKLKGLLDLGAEIAFVYLVDDAAKGPGLCGRDTRARYAIGYSSTSENLSTRLDAFRVRLHILDTFLCAHLSEIGSGGSQPDSSLL